MAGLLASIAAAFTAAVTPAATNGSDGVVMRFGTGKTFVMYDAGAGAEATNSGFHVPVFVEPDKDDTPARDVRVVVDAWAGGRRPARSDARDPGRPLPMRRLLKTFADVLLGRLRGS